MLILGLGSNMGDRAEHLRRAVALLAESVLTNLRCSAVYETPALLPQNAPEEWNIAFLNMAVAGECGLAPEDVLARVKAMEQRLGRIARGVWGPREIDIDILAFGGAVIRSDALTVPHAGLRERDFALVPLAEIAPQWRWPLPDAHSGLTAAELVRTLGMGAGLRRSEIQVSAP